MKVIDFRFRPNTQQTISGIQNSKMFKGLCESIDFSRMKPRPSRRSWPTLTSTAWKGQ